MLYRGAPDMPLTSGKINYGGAWQDAKTIIDYVHKNYVNKVNPQSPQEG